MKPYVAMGVACALVTFLPGCATSGSFHVVEDLPHFFMVDEHLYRGGQPTPKGFRRLAELGVKTIISLRAEKPTISRKQQSLVESLGMQWENLPMHSYFRPSDIQVQTFLDVASDPMQQPVFVHCRKGEDRTGVLVAAYRILKQGWRPERAYAEARALGMAGWNPFMRYLILHEAEREYAQVPQQDTQGSLSGLVPAVVFADRLIAPEDVACDLGGNLYISSEHPPGIVLRISPSGGRTVLTRGLKQPDGLSLDDVGNVYVAEERFGGNIYRVTPDGARSLVVANLQNPESLAFDASGVLHVVEDKVDGRVLRFAQGNLETLADGFDRPEGLAFDDAGNLYVTETGEHQLTRVRPGGERELFVSIRKLRNPDGLAYSLRYRGLFVAEDLPRGRLCYVSLTGDVMVLLYGLNHAQGLALDGQGNLYISERGRNRILKVAADQLAMAIPSGLTRISLAD